MTHIRFYLDGRKNNQYGGNFLDVARPEDPAVFGVYHVCLLAKAVFGSGFVLGSVDATGAVDRDTPMPHKMFVAHLRAALINIGLTPEQAGVYSAHSMRAGGPPQLRSTGSIAKRYSTWRAWRTPTGWPTTTGTTWPSAFASPRQLASSEEVGVWGVLVVWGRSLEKRERFHASQPQIPYLALSSSCLVPCYFIVTTG